jgi:outer membrane protein OmpA-like peptidoglycan-associated protein
MRTVVLITALALVTACATPGEKTAIGGGAGALVGAGIGGAAGGWEGAAIGALAGGLIGGAIGNYLDKQQQELQQVTNARRTENGLLVNLRSTLMFSTDSAVVKPGAVEELAQLGDILAKYPDDRIRIRGFTESSGSPAHDEELSLRRAQAVREILASRGVRSGQMLVEGAGAAQSIGNTVELFIDVPQQQS